MTYKKWILYQKLEILSSSEEIGIVETYADLTFNWYYLSNNFQSIYEGLNKNYFKTRIFFIRSLYLSLSITL